MQLIAIGHGQAQRTLNQNMLTWRKFFRSIQVVCPEGDPVKNLSITVHKIGKKQHHGQSSIDRILYVAKLASEYNGFTTLVEYDTIFFREFTPQKGSMLFNTLYSSDEPEYECCQYGHCPWVTDNKTWESIYNTPYLSLEGGFADRWIAYQCNRLRIPMVLLPHGYSENTINDGNLEAAKSAVRAGAVAIHGIKDEKIFLALTQSNQLFS